jgi:hypothetical protein
MQGYHYVKFALPLPRRIKQLVTRSSHLFFFRDLNVMAFCYKACNASYCGNRSFLNAIEDSIDAFTAIGYGF